MRRKGEFGLDYKNQFKGAEPRRPTAAEFARLSSSMQLTLVTIRRAQLSSRVYVAEASRVKPRPLDNGG